MIEIEQLIKTSRQLGEAQARLAERSAPIQILKQLAEAIEAVEASLERIEELEEEVGKARCELEVWLEGQ